jgi:hypothetical protein
MDAGWVERGGLARRDGRAECDGLENLSPASVALAGVGYKPSEMPVLSSLSVPVGSRDPELVGWIMGWPAGTTCTPVPSLMVREWDGRSLVKISCLLLGRRSCRRRPLVAVAVGWISPREGPQIRPHRDSLDTLLGLYPQISTYVAFLWTYRTPQRFQSRVRRS